MSKEDLHRNTGKMKTTIKPVAIAIAIAWLPLLTQVLPAKADSLNLNVTGKITPTTCTVSGSQPRIVQLGEVGVSRFTGIGATSAAKDFYIKLNCSSVVNLHVVFHITGDKDADNNALFALTGNDKASGIAIELLQQDAQTVLPPDSSLEWSPSSASDAAAGMKFHARYKQTRNTVVSGRGNGSVLIDVIYK